QDITGNMVRVKVVKNKVAPPFKQAEFDILFNEGISKLGELIDIGIEKGVIEKSGSWYSYKGDRIGQGRENARQTLKDNAPMAKDIEVRIKEACGLQKVETKASEKKS
ncbi:MAG: DNA recombination/repair protein RecA, partial [Nitrospirota bacterium]